MIPDRVLVILRWSCFFLFLGRGWQHLFWDAPYRAILWDEGLWSVWFELWFPMTWNQFVTSDAVDNGIQLLIRATGAFYLLCAAASLRVRADRRLEKTLLTLGSMSLLALSLLYYKEKFYQVGQLLEYALQVGAPLLLRGLAVAQSESERRVLIFPAKVAIALTFVCHGLYALGYYPVPGDFIEMTMRILGVEDATALLFLKTAGILDLLVGAGVFLGATEGAALAYAAAWGLLTAAGRVAAFVSWDSILPDLHQWLPETLLRLPHGLVPLAVLVLCYERGWKARADSSWAMLKRRHSST